MTTPPLRHYRAYGRCLATPLEFPELDPLAGVAPHWTFTAVPALEAPRAAIALGDDHLYAEVHARLWRHAAGHRLEVGDTGDFDLSADVRSIRWTPRGPAWPDFVRAHLLGRVLGTAMYLDGQLPLHASAVETRDGVIAFLAPKGFGKSALALALTIVGASFVSDDTLPVDPGPVPTAWPGVLAVRTQPGTLDALGVERPAIAPTPEGKLVLRDLPRARPDAGPRPLAALYVVDPAPPVTGVVSRHAMPPALAAVGVVAHVKIGSLLGADAVAPMLARATSVSGAVPVLQLRIARDLATLPSVAREILGWHGGGIG